MATKNKNLDLCRFFSFLSTLFFCYELGAGHSFFLLEISLLGLCKSLFRVLGATDFKPFPWKFWALPAIWIFVDLVNSLYSPAPAWVWQKYRFVLAISPVLFSYWVVGTQEIVKAVAGSAFLLAVVAMVNSYVYPIYPIYYTARISLRTDYNLFASALLFGMICGFFELLTNIKSAKVQWRMLIFISICFSVISQSASRRIYIILFPILFWMLAIVWKSLGVNAFRLIMALVLVCVSCSWLLYVTPKYAPTHPPEDSGTETTATERFESIGEHGMLTKRKIIWQIGWESLNSYTPLQWIVGRGNCSDILLYDTDDARLERVYPDSEKRKGSLSAHNFILADFLNGGLIKYVVTAALGIHLLILLLLLSIKNPTAASMLFILFLICTMNSFISNRFGLLYDRHFLIFTMALFLSTRVGEKRYFILK